jgi:hypothetical protein
MIEQWKQHLYAYVLRRVLAPILEDSARSSGADLDGSSPHHQLHTAFDVSNGTFALHDVALNADFVSSKLNGIAVSEVTVQTLEVQLSLQDEQEGDGGADDPSCEGSSSTTGTSLAWRALRLGGPAVSLVAKVIVTGAVVQVQACPKRRPGRGDDEGTNNNNSKGRNSDDNDDEVTGRSSSGNVHPPDRSSRLQRYFDAALASLQLTVEFHDLRVRVVVAAHGNKQREDDAENDSSNDQSFVECRMQSVRYHDVKTDAMVPSESAAATAAAAAQGEATVMLHKVLEVTRITVLTGTCCVRGKENSTGATAAAAVCLMDGMSRISWKALDDTSNSAATTETAKSNVTAATRSDLELVLHQKLNVSVDARALLQIRNVVDSFRNRQYLDYGSDSDGQSGSADAGNDMPWVTSPQREQDDLEALDSIWRQYQDARRMAERNQVRGGILVRNDEDEGMFDAFFDANEHGFSLYSSVLRESIAGMRSHDQGTDRVHTNVRFHLQEGGLKLAFIPDSNLSRPDEYVLLTFSEVNLAAAVSDRTVDFQFRINHLELEDSMLEDIANHGGGKTVAIGSLLRFSTNPNGIGDDDDDGSDCDMLAQSPCVALHVKRELGDKEDSSEVELRLEPMEISYRASTIANLGRLLHSLAWNPNAGNMTTHEDAEREEIIAAAPAQKVVNFYSRCASVTVLLPVAVEDDWSGLYKRCGYTSTGNTMVKSALGIQFDLVVVEMNKKSLRNEIAVSCHNIIASACSPLGQSVFDNRTHRFDILSLCGRTEVNPCIPISIKLIEIGTGDEDVAAKLFPSVPSISSFKARQEDEDDDNRIDRVLTSKLNPLNVNSRKELRGADPQSIMLPALAKTEILVAVHIPEILGDISCTELSLLNRAVESFLLVAASNQHQRSHLQFSDSAPLLHTALNITCDFFSGAVHTNIADGDDTAHSFVIKMDRFQAHALKHGSKPKHARILAHEINLYEGKSFVLLFTALYSFKLTTRFNHK